MEQLLSGEELVKQNVQMQKNQAPVLSRGLKKTHPEAGDMNELQAMYNELKITLGQERVERVTVRSQALYEPDEQPHSVRVIRKMGKWHLYGYVRNGIQYLHAHEALHLIEMNRLEVYYNRVIVSLQQAYAMLLGTTVTAEAYFVYSTLMRAGYVAELHDSANDRRPQQAASTVNFRDAKAAKLEQQQFNNCVWQCYALLQTNQLATVTASCTDEMLKSTALAMSACADRIRKPEAGDATSDATSEGDDDEEDVSDSGWNVQPVELKRKSKENASIKAPANSKEYPAELFLDRHLIADRSAEMVRFQNVFRTIRTINITHSKQPSGGHSAELALRFDFDLFIATSSFRKSNPGQPDYRVIVRRSADGVPSRRAILQTFLRQSYRSRILVVFVSAAMTMQAYSYTFAQ